MLSSNDILTPSDWTLLDQIGAATVHLSTTRSIKLRPLPGWPFAWLLHPGLTDGLTVADTASLARLEEAELIVINQKAGSRRAGQEILLTRQGMTTYRQRMHAGEQDGRTTRSLNLSKQHRRGGRN